jgi:hypothetical protein
MIRASVCHRCKHFDNKPGFPKFCKAFDKEPGIPDEIFFGANKHLEPYEGDQGIQFEAKEK